LRLRCRAPAVSIEVYDGIVDHIEFCKARRRFRAIVEAHRGLSETESADLDAALVLVLANHIGDIAVLREAIALAKHSVLEAAQQQQQQQQQQQAQGN
jgi:hypothetical protein